MKYYPTDWKGIEVRFVTMKNIIKTMVHNSTTEQLLKELAKIELCDPEFVSDAMAELCERGGLDMNDYKDFDDCLNAILHEYDVRNGEV